MADEAKKHGKNIDNEAVSMDVDDNEDFDTDNESVTELNNESSNNTPISSNPRRSRSNLTPADKSLRNQMRLESAKKKQEEKERKERERKEREEAARKKREEEEQLKLKRQEERERLAQERAEKEKLRVEAQKKREEERRLKKEKEEEERLKREEERKQKEEERRLKKEKEEEEKRLREEERKQKEEERRLRKEKEEEEKKQREKERVAREEEKRLKEEERQREEEEKRKKVEKAKENFVSFFIKKESPKKSTKDDQAQQKTRFMPFQPKENMTIAPICRRDDFLKMNEQERIDFIKQVDEQVFKNTSSLPNYLEQIKKNSKLIRKQTRSCRKLTKKTKSSDEIEELFSINVRTKYKVKYLHFDPKVFRRPPYYGTWRQKSKFVKPRKPFAKDEKLLNYEVDSDDEWEDEPDGESIASSAGDEDEEVPEEDEDDGFFVPHGHLSDDELDEDDRQLDPDIKKAREAAKKEQWETERKKASKVLIPKYFINSNYWSSEKKKENNSNELKLFERLQMVPLVTTFPIQIPNDNSSKVPNTDDLSTPKQKKNNNANLNGLNESSPSSATKNSKQNKKNQVQTQQIIQTTTTASLDQQAQTQQQSNQLKQAPANQPNILSFMSKKTNKVCKLEQINTDSATTKKANIELLEVKSPVPITNKPTSITQAQKAASSPKMTPNNSTTNLNSTAEKRVCSGNGENAVKRFRLDQSQSADQNGVQTLTVFKQGAKKSLKLGESNRVSLGSPTAVVNNNTVSNENIQKMDVQELNDSEKGTNKNGKENKECIVLD